MSWLGKSFDTFAPLGPCIVTADEIANPNDLLVRFWNDGQLRHNYNTDDMEHHVPELVEFATTVMTMQSGDIIACGTNHEGLGALQDGETVEIEVQGIGRMAVNVVDPLKRKWERGVYMGANSTHPEAVKRNRPRNQAATATPAKECVMKADDLNLKPQYRMPRVFGALPGPRNVPKDKQNLPDNQTEIARRCNCPYRCQAACRAAAARLLARRRAAAHGQHELQVEYRVACRPRLFDFAHELSHRV